MPIAATLSDDEILARVRCGDTASYECIMRRYNQRLFRVARVILKSDTDAEDAVQNAYVQAYFHLNQFEGNSAFSTWLTRIAVREACALLRRSHSRATAEVKPVIDNTRSNDNPERDLLRLELRTLIEQATDRLPADYRLVFVLRDIEELSTAETASCLNVSEDTVKVRLHRSRAILRRELYATTGSAVKNVFAFDGLRCDRIVRAVLAILSASEQKEP